MTLDVEASLRRRKPERRLSRLSLREPNLLRSVYEIGDDSRMAVILDTNAYILQAAGKLPPEAANLVDRGLQFHCSVCLSELSIGLANASPSNAALPVVRDHYLALFASIPSTRLLTPDANLWIDAGLIAGTLARTQNFQRHQRKECLNDALIFLTAARAGIPVLTQDRADFDLIQQLAPEGAFIYF